jgi:hypothetical protein
MSAPWLPEYRACLRARGVSGWATAEPDLAPETLALPITNQHHAAWHSLPYSQREAAILDPVRWARRRVVGCLGVLQAIRAGCAAPRGAGVMGDDDELARAEFRLAWRWYRDAQQAMRPARAERRIAA